MNLIGEYNIAMGLPNADQWRRDTVSIFKAHGISRTAWEFYCAGSAPSGDPPNENLSATDYGGSTPGAWKSWLSELL